MPTRLLSFSTLDFNGHEKQTLLYFASTATLADLTAYAAGYQSLHEAVSQGRLVKAVASFDVMPALTSNALPAIRCNSAARLTFNTNGVHKFGVYIPVIDPAVVNDNEIDITDAGVIALAAAISSGIGGVVPTNESGLDVGSLSSGKYSYIK